MASRNRDSTEVEARSLRADAISLVLITLVTALPYVTRLGFYSDDWYVLWSFHSDAFQHRFGIHSILREFSDRPLQGLYLGLLYRLFGPHPLGYHLVNTAVIAIAMPLFYWLLVRMRADRATAFAAAAVLIVLPQLSTVRVWYVTFQIPLSMLTAFVSLHCQLSFARTGRIGWAIGAAIAAVLSVAAYEIFAPLIAAFPLVLLAMQWRRFRGPGFRRLGVVLLGLVLLVALLALAKYWISPRPQAPDLHRYLKGLIQLVRPDYDWRTDFSLNIFAAASVQFWWPIIGWLRGAEAVLQGGLGWGAATAAIVVALMVFWRVRRSPDPVAGPWTNGRLLLLGAAVFALGHAAFVIVPAMSFSPTGMSNRALIAAAIGVAMIFIGAIRCATNPLKPEWRAVVFRVAIGLIALLGTLRIAQIESYWTEAPAIQARILTAARFDLKGLPPQSFVMLDGVCPYHGPAVVFEAPWDVSGALSLAAGKTIRGDAVSPRMMLRRDGLATSIYGEPAFYPYGRDLYVYDPDRHWLVQLRDFGAARRYFSHANHSRTPCPHGYVGQGVLI